MKSNAVKSKVSLLVATLLVSLSVGCSRTDTKADAQKAEAQLVGEIHNRFGVDPTLAQRAIHISAKNGVVTLTGQVKADSEVIMALNAAQGVEGVKQVVSMLQVEAAQPVAEATSKPVEQEKPRVIYRTAPARATAPRTVRTSFTDNPPVAASAPVQNAQSALPSYSAPAVQQVAAMPAAPAEPRRITIPAGTELHVRTISTLSSETSRPDEIWHGTLNSDIRGEDDETVVIPAGADVQGRVVAVKPATHYTGQSELTLQVTRIVSGGKTYQVSTDQWQRKGNARGKNTAAKVGTGAAVGAVLGGIFGGGKGAAIGAAAGAGAGAGANTITKGQKVELGPESLLVFRLESSLNATPSTAGRYARNEYVAPRQQQVEEDSDPDRPRLIRR